MIVLGMDTATRATTAAVWEPAADRVVERRDDPAPGTRPRHTTRLLALAAAALQDAGADWADIGLIAVGTGPGTFTGIRIGVATARALASARALPIVGVSTLHALAAHAAADPVDGRPVLAVLDARRGEAFVAGWSREGAGDATATPLIAPCAIAPQALAEAVSASGESWLAVGEGAVEFRSLLESAGAHVPDDGSHLHRVTAIEICRLGSLRPPRTPGDIHPEYLRLPDAELNRRAVEAGRTTP